MFSNGLENLLRSEHQIEVVGQDADIERAIQRFNDLQPDVVTLAIAERCCFELRYGLQELPQFPMPPGLTAAGYLQQLCNAALPHHYPEPASRVRAQLAHELAVIEQAGLANYFLIVWDIVRFAREQSIRGQGRGSAANSLVAYLLGISPIDPLAHDLVFERFLSSERATMPDIDLDFQADRRRRSSSTFTDATAPTTRRWPAPWSPFKPAVRCGMWAKFWGYLSPC